MKKDSKIILVITLALSLTACGQNMATNGTNSKSTVGGDDVGSGDPGTGSQGSFSQPDIDYEAIQLQALTSAAQAEELANKAASEAEKALNKISLGSGGISFGNGGDVDAQLVVDKMVKKILDKVVEKLDVVPEKLNEVRAQLVEAMAKLDENNPLHQRGVDALMKAMEKVDEVGTRYKKLLMTIADKVNLVASRLDVLAAGVPFPMSLLVGFELSEVKVVLANFQQQLRNR